MLLVIKIIAYGEDYAPAPSNIISSGAGYTVTFIIHDSLHVLAGAYITFNGQVLVSDSNGMAIFTQVPDGSASFLIQEAGYSDYTKDTLIYGDEFLNVNMNKLCSIKFTITNGINPLKGSIVVINGDSAFADSNGVAIFGKIFPGNSSYSYTVSSVGYRDSTSIASLSNTDLIIQPIVLNKAYNIVFNVKDSLNNPIEGAQITINSNSMITDSLGEAVFVQEIPGSYLYNIAMSGYSDYFGNLVVSDSNIIIKPVLSIGYDLVLTIINGYNGIVPLENDTVKVNGISKISDANGIITFGLQTGVYPITFHKTGFVDTSITLDMVNQNLNLNIYMIPRYTVVFNVADALSFNPIKAGTVRFNGVSKSIDGNGNAEFMEVSPSDSNVFYQVIAGGGYFMDTGSISLPFTSVTVNDLNTIYQSVYLIRPGIAISLTEDSMTYFGSAILKIDGIDYSYDSIVGTSFVNIDTGIHNYTVIPDDVTKAIVSGSFAVDSSGSDFLQVQMLTANKVEISAVDNNNNPIADAKVIFNGDTQLTNNSGDAIFNRIAAGSYSYSITKYGFESIPNILINVDTSVETVFVKMKLLLYSVTIIVSDAGGVITGAAVTMDDTIINTGSDGKAMFAGIPIGEYSFTVVKSGYIDSIGTITITNSDIIRNILLVMTGVKNAYSISLMPFPNPTTGSIYLSIPLGLNYLLIRVINENGTLLMQNVYENVQGTLVMVDLHELPTGNYTIELVGREFKKAWSVSKK